MTSSCILRIDTRSTDQTIVTLVCDGKEIQKVLHGHTSHSQVVLRLIEELLVEQHKKLTDITAIETEVDSGSFTGRRVGAVIASTLGVLLHVPVNHQKADILIDIPYTSDRWQN